MNNVCTHLKQLLEAEKPLILEGINMDRSDLSRKAKHDVGLEEAKRYFVEHDLDKVAIGFKYCYCNFVCEDKNSCDLRSGYD